MSSADKPAHDEVCASCGTKGGNYIKLKTCDACKLVKYCSVACQRMHRPRHKQVCKQRAAELRDELLFQQPDCTHFGDCPICFVPIPWEEKDDTGTGVMQSGAVNICCSKRICIGCIYESRVQGVGQNCPYCRTPYPANEAQARKLFDKQFERGNPEVLRMRAFDYLEGGNYSEGIKILKQLAEGGDIDAHQVLGREYCREKNAEIDSLHKAIYHLEQAVIGGHPYARLTLGIIESTLGNTERAVKHWIIGAKLGSKKVLEMLKKGYQDGTVSKEAFEEALRGYQDAVNATKTPQREVAMQNPHVVCTSEEIWSKSAKLQNLSKVAKLR